MLSILFTLKNQCLKELAHHRHLTSIKRTSTSLAEWIHTLHRFFSKVKSLKSSLFSTQMPDCWSGFIRKNRESGMICRTQRTQRSHESSALLQGNKEIWRARREQITDRLCWEDTQELRGYGQPAATPQRGSQRTNAHLIPSFSLISF